MVNIWNAVRSTVQKMGNFLQLLGIKLVVLKRDSLEFLRVAYHYYWSNWQFCKIDCALLFSYLFNPPFAISKRFLTDRGAKEIYAYGETPLTTLQVIAKECQLSSKDTLFELGCGRGRTCFWLNSFIGCHVIGIEYIPEFVKHADLIKERFHIDGVEFRRQNFLETNFQGATAIYLYGTCMDDLSIKKLIARLDNLPAGTKIITVSYPLSDYTTAPKFEVMKRFPAQFTWGSGDVYLQLKK